MFKLASLDTAFQDINRAPQLNEGGPVPSNEQSDDDDDDSNMMMMTVKGN